MNVDFIVVGQGVCGTFLSYYLLEKGFSVIVVDQFRENTASQIASGVINPVTGRRIVKTWMIRVLKMLRKNHT
ncbi:FAD-dependent oxidoreductase [Rhizosphaericola mali]|uniref:FAD-binding oxidoreductase n=1 Tax=Rhizosphaericola mali TaxID=2545455 RepID=A0A5P2FXS9_9BACT|nr:FAD-dependent oxidoreductase [Rhizosphaericola mali]QES87747.1 FAD-binding oxidoreductase [Rhizosphaericola mali]